MENFFWKMSLSIHVEDSGVKPFPQFAIVLLYFLSALFMFSFSLSCFSVFLSFSVFLVFKKPFQVHLQTIF